MKTIAQLCLALTIITQTAHAEEARWWKGNLHTHSLWSDGDDYPEMIADWYRMEVPGEPDCYGCAWGGVGTALLVVSGGWQVLAGARKTDNGYSIYCHYPVYVRL